MRFKKFLVTVLFGCLLCFGATATAYAYTVYYKGSAVFWNYGRNAAAWGFSDCNSQSYEHCSSVNGYSSGWKDPGVLSTAWGWVGSNTLEAYWDCRG